MNLQNIPSGNIKEAVFVSNFFQERNQNQGYQKRKEKSKKVKHIIFILSYKDKPKRTLDHES